MAESVDKAKTAKSLEVSSLRKYIEFTTASEKLILSVWKKQSRDGALDYLKVFQMYQRQLELQRTAFHWPKAQKRISSSICQNSKPSRLQVIIPKPIKDTKKRLSLIGFGSKKTYSGLLLHMITS